MRLHACLALLFACAPALAAEHAGHAMKDGRQAIVANAEEAAHVRLEMRGFLTSVQQIAAAAATNDMPKVAAAARASGVAAAHAVPAGLRARLPGEFKRLGQATHMGFDDLARDAESFGDAGQAMRQLGQVMENCVACHGSFRLRERPAQR